jgi:broad specificity phosphatase PhoE
MAQLVTTLYLVRHGETVWHAENRYAGRSDIALTNRGLDQAETLARWSQMQPIDAVYSSDLSRAVNTATPSAKALGVPVTPVVAFREVDFGRGEGLTAREMHDQFPVQAARFMTHPATSPLPNAESGKHAATRGWAALQTVATGNPDGTILIVMHSTLMRLILCRALHIPLDQYRRAFPSVVNVGITTLSWADGPASILNFNVPVDGFRS